MPQTATCEAIGLSEGLGEKIGTGMIPTASGLTGPIV